MLGMRTGLCPILLFKHPLNRPGRFARRPDRRSGRQANRSERIYIYIIEDYLENLMTFTTSVNIL